MKALDTNSITAAYLKEQGREGQFVWRTGDYSDEVNADTAEGIYIKADAVSATVGAWVRVYAGAVNVRWFGARGDEITDDTSAFNAAFSISSDVFAPRGVYSIYGLIEKKSVRGPSLRGDGPSETIIDFADISAKISLAGIGTRVNDIHFRPRTSAIPVCLEIGDVDGIYVGSMGSNISGNVFGNRSSGAYFIETIRTVNLWYSDIVENFFGTEGAAGTVCINGFYSVNIVVANNTCEAIGCFVYWRNDTHPTFGNVCEGWIISTNACAALNTFFYGEGGLLPIISDNIIDIVFGIAVVSWSGSTLVSGNWIVSNPGNDSPLLFLEGSSSIACNNRIQSNSSVPNVIEMRASEQIVKGNYVYGGVRAVSDTVVDLLGLIVTDNIFKAQTLQAAAISAMNSVYKNNVEIESAAPTLGYGVRRDRREFDTIANVTSDGMQTLVSFDFPVPAGVFSATPTFAVITALNTADVYYGAYAPSESSPTSLRVRIARVDGGTIPAAVAVSLYARQ